MTSSTLAVCLSSKFVLTVHMRGARTYTNGSHTFVALLFTSFDIFRRGLQSFSSRVMDLNNIVLVQVRRHVIAVYVQQSLV